MALVPGTVNREDSLKTSEILPFRHVSLLFDLTPVGLIPSTRNREHLFSTNEMLPSDLDLWS